MKVGKAAIVERQWMELAMADGDEIDFGTLDYRAWTLDQRSAFKSRVLKSAHAARSECLKSAFCLLVFALRRIGTLVARAWRAHTARQRWQMEIAELQGFDEPMLRDIGITRFEVNTLFQGRPAVERSSTCKYDVV